WKARAVETPEKPPEKAKDAMQTDLKKPEHSTLYVAGVAFFVTDLLVSHVMAVKPISPFTLFGHPVILQAADLIFPVTYILGDILTEVYGFKRARKAIWIGFACNLFAALAIYLGQVLPPNADWHDQSAYDAIL